MSKKKSTPNVRAKNKAEVSLVRSSAAEYLTFVAASGQGGSVIRNFRITAAEDMALREIPMTMQDWETRLNRFIAATDRHILQDAGKVTAEIAQAHAESEFEKYRIVQDRLFESDFDRMIKQLPKEGGK